MTNNRLMIRCRSCGKTLIIAKKKHFLTPWRTVPNLDDKLTEFFNEHYFCKVNNIVYLNSFELISEFGEGFPNEEDEVLTHYYDIYAEDYEKEVAKQKEGLKYEKVHSDVIKMWYSNKNKEDSNDNSNPQRN